MLHCSNRLLVTHNNAKEDDVVNNYHALCENGTLPVSILLSSLQSFRRSSIAFTSRLDIILYRSVKLHTMAFQQDDVV